MDSDNWWKIYLDTVYQNEDDLQEYMRAFNVTKRTHILPRVRTHVTKVTHSCYQGYPPISTKGNQIFLQRVPTHFTKGTYSKDYNCTLHCC